MCIRDSFEDQENVIAALFDARDNFGDLFRIREGFVDGFAEFLHQIFELLVHVPPDRSLLKTSPQNFRCPGPLNGSMTAKGLRYCSAPGC